MDNIFGDCITMSSDTSADNFYTPMRSLFPPPESAFDFTNRPVVKRMTTPAPVTDIPSESTSAPVPDNSVTETELRIVVTPKSDTDDAEVEVNADVINAELVLNKKPIQTEIPEKVEVKVSEKPSGVSSLEAQFQDEEFPDPYTMATQEITDNPPVPITYEQPIIEGTHLIGRQVVCGRICTTHTTVSTTKVCSTFNPMLAKFVDDFVIKNEPLSTDTIIIPGVNLTKGRGVGIWEEGGFHDECGSVLVATTPSGDKIAPTSVFYNEHTVNGRHALLPIWERCFIILGGCYQRTKKIAIYQVTVITDTKKRVLYKNDTSNVSLSCELVATYDTKEFKVFAEKPAVVWSPSHPAVIAALQQVTKYHAVRPCYVSDYRAQRFDPDLRMDFNSCLHDSEYMSLLRKYDTLEEAYHDCGEVLRQAVSEISQDNSYRARKALLYVYVVYNEASECIVVYLLALKYNTIANTSAQTGNRLWYGRVVLSPGTKFHYPDQAPDKAQDFEVVLRCLRAAPYNGKSMIVLRRMTR